MEFIFILVVLWILGSIFGNKSGGSTLKPSNDPPRPPPVKPLIVAKPISERKSIAPMASDSARVAIEGLFANPVPQRQLTPAAQSWQAELGGRILKESVCSPGMGDHISDYLSERGFTKLYHFTDRRNIESIIRTGGLYSSAFLKQSSIEVPRPGGNELSRNLDVRSGLQDYVRLSFIRDNPMMYAAKADGRISDPVILEIDIDVVRFPDVIFSDRNATANGCVLGSGVKMLQNINLDLVRRGRWKSDKEKGFIQAEVLVRDVVPGYLIKHEGRAICDRSVYID